MPMSVALAQIFRLIRKAARTSDWHYRADHIFEQRHRESVLNDLQGEKGAFFFEGSCG